MHTRDASRPTLLVALGLLCLGLLVFGQVRSFGFSSYDDTVYVSENPTISAGLTWEGVKEVTLHGQHLLWTPLTSLSYMLGCEVYGLNPAGHHLTNLLLHLMGVLLLFYTLRSLTGAFWPSAFVAAVFAIHPLNVEPVAWVSGRKEQLFVIFWLLSLLAYRRYVKNRGVLPYLLVMLCHLAGLASKPTHLMLPLVLLLLDVWPLHRIVAGSTMQRLRCLFLLAAEKIPLLALSLAVTFWTFTTVDDAGGLRDLSAVPLSERIPNTIWVYGWYLKQIVLPANLTVHYPYPEAPVDGLLVRAILFGLVFLTLVAITYLRRFPVLALGWGWFVLVLFPTSGLLRANSFLMADRYGYVPMIGLLIMLTWGVPLLIGRVTKVRWLTPAMAILFLLSLLPNAYRQTTYWENDLTLFGHAVTVIPDSPVAHNSYGRALREAGRLAEAEEHFLRATQVPGPFRILPHMNLGTMYAQAGLFGPAEEQFTIVVNGNPGYAPGHAFLGRVLLDRAREAGLTDDARNAREEQGRLALATAFSLDPAQAGVQQLLAALSEDQRPDPAEVALNLGQLFERVGRRQEATAYYDRAAQYAGEDADTLRRMGEIMMNRGRFAGAETLFRRALRITPDDLPTTMILGSLLALDSRPEAAREVYRGGLRYHSEDSDLLERLGSTEAALGNDTAAAEALQAAVDADPKNEAAQYHLHQLTQPAGTTPPIAISHPSLTSAPFSLTP